MSGFVSAAAARRAELVASLKSVENGAPALRDRAAKLRDDSARLLREAETAEKQAADLERVIAGMGVERDKIAAHIALLDQLIEAEGGPTAVDPEPPSNDDDDENDSEPDVLSLDQEASVLSAALAMLDERPGRWVTADDAADRMLQAHPEWSRWTTQRRLRRFVRRIYATRAKSGDIDTHEGQRGTVYMAKKTIKPKRAA